MLMLSGSVFLRPPHEEHGAWSVTPFLRSGGGGTGDGSWMRADLHPGDLLYIPAGWWHATESTSSNTVSINFFMSACFAALGVIVPKIAEPDWFCDDASNDPSARTGPQIHSRNG